MRKKKIAALILTAVFPIVFILAFSEIKSDIINAVCVCGRSIIPSLFPLTAVSVFAADYFSDILKNTKGKLIFAWIFSLIGGFPMGAVIISSMYENGEIEKYDAAKAAARMFCAGPAFTVLFVGEQLFSSKSAGLVLYCAEVIPSLIQFLIFIRGDFKESNAFPKKTKTFILSFTNAVQKSSAAVFTVSTYVIFFAALVSTAKTIIPELPVFVIGLAEVTTGVLSTKNIYLTGVLLFFGGISVHSQIFSLCEDFIDLKQFYLQRLFGVFAGEILLFLSVKFFGISVMTAANNAPALAFSSADTVSSVCILISLAVLLITLSKKLCGKNEEIML